MQGHKADPSDAARMLSPFGPADGAQLRPFDMVDLYAEELEGLTVAPASRLIVARSGAGKSCFVKRVHARILQDDRVASSAEIQRGQPAVAELVAIGERWPAPVRSELWSYVWRAAILRSFASHVLCGDELRQLDDVDGLGFRSTWTQVLRDCAACTTPVNVFSQIREIVANMGSEMEFRAYLRSDKWELFGRDLAKMLEASRPACLIIDLDDEMTAEVPGPWVSCQRGLLRAVDWLNRGPLAGLLIIVATSREQHYAALLGTDKGFALRDSILLLDVDESDTAAYLDRMLSLIDTREGGDLGNCGLARLVDCTPIENVARRRHEDVKAYMVRHTRSLPRDIVVLGNELARRRAQTGEGEPLDHKEVRRSVRGCARLFGGEQLATCAMLLAAGMSPEDVVAEYMQSYFATPGGYDNPTVRVRLSRVISGIGVDRFSRDVLERARVDSTGEFPDDVVEALWRCGLLGYTSPDFPVGHVAFFSLRTSGTEIPDSTEYAFHPCLIDALMLDHGGPSRPPTTPIADPQ